MSRALFLASGSAVRATLLRNAGLSFTVAPARIDEATLRASMQAEGHTPRDLADLLAEFKAAKVAARQPEAMVIGCDQILDLDGRPLEKPVDPEDAREQLSALAGRTHDLYSAAVLFDQGTCQWRHVARVRLTMRPLSERYIEDYVARNWDEIRHCVGCYQLEGEAARFFTRIDGDFFTVLGLPLLPLLDHLATRGVIET